MIKELCIVILCCGGFYTLAYLFGWLPGTEFNAFLSIAIIAGAPFFPLIFLFSVGILVMLFLENLNHLHWRFLARFLGIYRG